jgi:hypothetical protein
MICPVCNNETSKLQRIGELFQPPDKWWVCTCGTKFREPMPTQAQLDKYYKSAYREKYPSVLSEYIRESWIVSTLLPKIPGTLLDVGCSDGTVLKDASACGWQAEGVEPDRNNRARASAYGIVYPSLAQVKKHYSWLVASHVIEHVEKPYEFMKQMQILADNFVFIVPIASYSKAHMFSFQENGFNTLLVRAGFTITASGRGNKPNHYWTVCK